MTLASSKPSVACKIDFESLVLKQGSHSARKGEYCLLEAAACYAGEQHTDHPESVSPAIAAFGRAWNDALDDEARQMLKPYVFRVIGTNTGAADEERRAWMATDWLVRKFAPAWLDLAGLGQYGNKLRALPELTTDELATAAQSEIEAAYSAARSAADKAAYSAARSAADKAAYSAARSAADSAACSAARSAADKAAYSAARSAADKAAGSALAPTVELLQKDALRLLDRMIAVGKTEVAS